MTFVYEVYNYFICLYPDVMIVNALFTEVADFIPLTRYVAIVKLTYGAK